MTITLWGRLSSGNVQKVVWALEELELPYELSRSAAASRVTTRLHTWR